ncbi:hypothetical protein MSG28_004248 [Choristoneura fumiferana]|uniref:Uncharacterized protein n=1 Tax=Choristoneura fumiferana TaxID=7141 RepID=A0ACC0KI38_CHOFU|nr:hypothetical protein MSG28_004248 [Choristoneura fumiferana]
MKYVLNWNGDAVSFINWETGQEEFNKRKCKSNNCYLTRDELFLKSIADFDAIAFLIPEIARTFPRLENRSIHQKYVYVSLESAKYFPLCDEAYDGLFNWTWTYKLDSVLPSGYVVVRNINGDIIGPKRNMNWIQADFMKPINDTLRERLKTKNKTVVWFASNCNALSKRQEFAEQLHYELKNYNLNLHVFGDCGTHKCPRDKMKDCLKMIERDYYFYLALENSFADDYVTEKLLWALQYYAIPVVFGGANYTR